ncbi:hypothetical protein B0J12DRAFT_241281 [Macrophomina phaseolina]|uniref:Uncharacterized protein n=1 Tax=Macrophomina phaseolina TaxID=35725 RepID=A0ABQ8GTZ1_9PEZI|nr:hypothetical protein B0J12DRAFT_241281 [Macrophomina phaseolina]
MHFHSITAIFLGALAIGCAAKDHERNSNGTDDAFNSTVHACHKMAKLTALSEIAANQTETDRFLSRAKNQTKAQGELDGAAAKLQAMSANATLVGTCQVVDAHEELKASCKQMAKLQKLVDASSNSTLKQELLDKAKNQTKIDEKIASASSKLQSMRSNTTLVTECNSLEQEKQAQNAEKGTSASASSSPSSSATSGAETIAVGKAALGLLATIAIGAATLL